MQTKLNKSKKIIKETKKEHKANKTGFGILSLSSKKFYIKHFYIKHMKQAKTLIISKESYQKVAPLKTTPHKESNKICFGIFEQYTNN